MAGGLNGRSIGSAGARAAKCHKVGAAGRCLLVTALASGCTSDGSSDNATPDAPSTSTAPPATGEQMALDVLVYNIEYGGNASTDKVIRTLDADIVGVLESYNRLPEIAEKTGYPYYNVGLQLLSKYPIHEPSGADGLYALIEVQPGYAVAFFNTHLDYVAYGPRLLAHGMPVADVVASENDVRTSSMQILLPDIAATSLCRLSDVPDRRLQSALQPRLHRRDDRNPPRGHRGGAVAGERSTDRHRLPRHVPRHQSRPRGQPRPHPRQP